MIWKSTITHPPPMKTKIVAPGTKWERTVVSSGDVLTKIPKSVHTDECYDIGVFTRNEAGQLEYDSSAISSDKNSYELWRGIPIPALWCELE